MSSQQFSALSDVAQNIVFFCSPCLYKLPGALMAFDNTSEVCSSVEQKIKSTEITLSNNFDSLVDQVNELSSKLCENSLDLNEPPSNQSSVSNKTQHSNISQAFSSVLSEKREKDKRRLNLILHNVPESTNQSCEKRKQDDTDTAVANI